MKVLVKPLPVSAQEMEVLESNNWLINRARLRGGDDFRLREIIE